MKENLEKYSNKSNVHPETFNGEFPETVSETLYKEDEIPNSTFDAKVIEEVKKEHQKKLLKIENEIGEIFSDKDKDKEIKHAGENNFISVDKPEETKSWKDSLGKWAKRLTLVAMLGLPLKSSGRDNNEKDAKNSKPNTEQKSLLNDAYARATKVSVQPPGTTLLGDEGGRRYFMRTVDGSHETKKASVPVKKPVERKKPVSHTVRHVAHKPAQKNIEINKPPKVEIFYMEDEPKEIVPLKKEVDPYAAFGSRKEQVHHSSRRVAEVYYKTTESKSINDGGVKDTKSEPGFFVFYNENVPTGEKIIVKDVNEYVNYGIFKSEELYQKLKGLAREEMAKRTTAQYGEGIVKQ